MSLLSVLFDIISSNNMVEGRGGYSCLMNYSSNQKRNFCFVCRAVGLFFFKNMLCLLCLIVLFNIIMHMNQQRNRFSLLIFRPNFFISCKVIQHKTLTEVHVHMLVSSHESEFVLNLSRVRTLKCARFHP